MKILNWLEGGLMEIIDVTLRDGGHAVDFDWPIGFAREYYSTLSRISDVNTIELGYWGQTSKTDNTFYNLDFDKVLDVTQKSKLNNVSVMIDYHYCSHDVKNYPTIKQNEISMIRMCARKEDMKHAVEFGKELKKYTGLNVSYNIFNASNYSKEEIDDISEIIKEWPFDYIYFADTHGDIDLTQCWDKFENFFNVCKKLGKKTGFHLHDHSGLAMVNYRELLKKEGLINSTDTSVCGMGKGSGNLRLEYVLSKQNISILADFILDYKHLLKMNPSPYELITSKYGVTDNYAKDGEKNNLDMFVFDSICSKISGVCKDSYSKDIFNE